MPHLVQMDKTYSKKGMVLIGAEVQGSSSEAVAKMVDAKGLKFTVTKGISGPDLSRGIPHMAVFDVKGNLLVHGHPNDPKVEKAIKAALKDAKLEGEAGGGAADPFAKSKMLVEQREWVNSDGKKLTAALVSLEGTTGQFRFANGRKFSYDITKLSESDQALIRGNASGDSVPEGAAKEAEDKFDF